MENKNQKIEKERGYAILFTIVVVGIISMITIGLSNAAYKQMVLSSVARDSTTAFYQADIASECALYADSEYNMLTIPENWKCSEIPLSFTESGTEVNMSYGLELPVETSSNNRAKCFRIIVEKNAETDTILTKVLAYGYNICNKSNGRTVERAIEVNY